MLPGRMADEKELLRREIAQGSETVFHAAP